MMCGDRWLTTGSPWEGEEMSKEKYSTITVWACEGGWVLRETGKPDRIFTIWRQLVSEIENRLTSKGDEVQK
jgi:hypothetical protein